MNLLLRATLSALLLLRCVHATRRSTIRSKISVPGPTFEDDVRSAFADEEFRRTIEEVKSCDDDACQEEPSPYRFDWANTSFEERWEAFRNAVPLSELQDHMDPDFDTGPACHPSLEGPRDSINLAILIHGFTSCPATLFPITKLLISEGFRVLRPTLPGHGRKWDNVETNVCALSDAVPNKSEVRNDTTIVPDALTACTTTVQRKDDLSHFPEEPSPYLYFAESLGELAEQFRTENPDGIIVVLGHSLGGMVAAKFALERPTVIDRLLLMNPMFGLHTNLLKPVLHAGAGARVSWSQLGNTDCEALRGKNSGGFCQFKMANILAMSSFAHVVLCEQWGLEEACRYYSAMAASWIATGMLASKPLFGLGLAVGSLLGPIGAAAGSVIGGTIALATGLWVGGRTGAKVGKALGKWKISDPEVARTLREGFGKFSQIQIVTTVNDPAIDNKRVESLVDEINMQRVNLLNVSSKSDLESQRLKLQAVRDASSYCYWPSDLTHCYNNARDVPSPNLWFHPYVEASLSNFLAHGSYVDIVERASPPWKSKNIPLFGWCLKRKTQVADTVLTILPAVQHSKDYVLGSARGAFPMIAEVVLVAIVRKQSEVLKVYSQRIVEVLTIPSIGLTLLVTRRKPDATVRDIFLLVGNAKRRNSCVEAGLQKLSNNGKIPLLDQMSQSLLGPFSQSLATNGEVALRLKFCGSADLASEICERQGCA